MFRLKLELRARLILGITLLAIGPGKLAAQNGDNSNIAVPVISAVALDYSKNTLNISINLSATDRATAVSLGGVLLKFERPTATSIIATIPANQFTRGTAYLLDISTEKFHGPFFRLSFDVAYGLQGPQGVQGPPGPQGVIGAQGPKGVVGPQGVKGDIGLAGARGDSGPQGIQGPKGEKGDPSGSGVTVLDANNNVLGTLVGIYSNLPPNGVTVYKNGYFIGVDFSGRFSTGVFVLLWTNADCSGTGYVWDQMNNPGGNVMGTKVVIYAGHSNSFYVPLGAGSTATSMPVSPVASVELRPPATVPNPDGSSYCSSGTQLFPAGSLSSGWLLSPFDASTTLGWNVSGSPLGVAGPIKFQ